MDAKQIETQIAQQGAVTLSYPHAQITLTRYDQRDGNPGETFTPEEKAEYFRGVWVTIDGWCRCADCEKENPSCESSLGHVTGSFAHWRVAHALEQIARELH